MHHLLSATWALSFYAMGALAAQSPQSTPRIRVENRSNAPYSGWVYATLPIPRGIAPDERVLQAVTLIDPVSQSAVPTVLSPLKWHWEAGARTSIALARLRAHVQLSPQARLEFPVQWGRNTDIPFTPHSDIMRWTSAGPVGNDVFLLARFAGDPRVYVARAPGELRELEQDNGVLVLRGRGRFVAIDDASVVHPMSMTCYWTLQSQEAHGSVTWVVGNDTLERPVSGGIAIDELLLVHRLPFLTLPKNQPTAGVVGPLLGGGFAAWRLLANTSLGDGQSAAMDFAFCVAYAPASPAITSMEAAAASPLVGLADIDSWRASHAAGPVGVVPPPRFTSLDAGRAALEGLAVMPASAPEDDLGLANRNPPQTGDQPDFMSNIPVFYVQVAQTASVTPLMRAIVAAKRESWRPSYYWDHTSGHWDHVSLLTYPQLFFWSGRVHYDPSWNTQYPTWLTRTGSFLAGDFHNWAGMDNQHFGHNGVRGVYELTADPYLADLLKANMSVAYWDFFTDWMGSTEAERTGRIVKEAVMLYELFPDAPEAPALRTAIGQKLQVFANAALAAYNQYGFPAIASVRDDPRVSLTQQFPHQDVHMSWQAGFHMEAAALAWRILGDPNAGALMRHYLALAHLLFLPDGTPKTYALMSDPSQYTTGGIGLTWWSGWLLADQLLPNHGNHALLSQRLRALILQEITPPQPFTIWWPNDRWRCFD